MSSFTSQAELEILDDFKFKLLRSFEFHVGEYPSEDIITVPVGFITDLASVPKILWSILPPHGKWAKAAIIHDYLYSVHNNFKTRTQSDKVFLEGMKVLEVPYIKRILMYLAVRLCGSSSFKGSK